MEKKGKQFTEKKIEIKMISPVSPQSLLPIPFDGMAKQEIQLQTFCKAFSQRKKEESQWMNLGKVGRRDVGAQWSLENKVRRLENLFLFVCFGVKQFSVKERLQDYRAPTNTSCE